MAKPMLVKKAFNVEEAEPAADRSMVRSAGIPPTIPKNVPKIPITMKSPGRMVKKLSTTFMGINPNILLKVGLEENTYLVAI